MVIRMLTKLRRRMKNTERTSTEKEHIIRNQAELIELKNTITELKIHLEKAMASHSSTLA